MRAQGCKADAIVFNAIVDALWETGVVWVQRRALRLFRVAVEEGHFHQVRFDVSRPSCGCWVAKRWPPRLLSTAAAAQRCLPLLIVTTLLPAPRPRPPRPARRASWSPACRERR